MIQLILSAFALASVAGMSAPEEKVIPAFGQPIPNIPGKSLVAAVVQYPPAGASKPHRHAPSAFIFAYVLSGHITSSVNGSPARDYGPGESWAEPPGAHHSISRNASATSPARLLAVFVVNSSDRKLVIPDPSKAH